MTRSLIIAFLLSLLSTAVIYGQPAIPKEVNSLYEQLKKSNADTSRVSIFIKICRYDIVNSARQPALLDSALSVANRAKVLSDKLGYSEGIGLSYQLMAQAWCGKKDFKKGDVLIKKALTVFLAQGLYHDAAEAYLNMEEFYRAAGGKDFSLRISYYEKAQPLFHKVGAFEREGATLKILGDFYQVQGDINKAYTILQQSLAIYQKTKVRELQGLYDLLGYTAAQLGDYQQAVKYGLLAVKTAESVNDYSLQLCTIYNRLGVTYNRLTQYQQSAKYYDNALKIAVKFKDTATILQVMLNDADALLHVHKSIEGLKIVKYYTAKFPTVSKDYQLMTLTTFVVLYLDLKQVSLAGVYCNRMLALVNGPGIDRNIQMSVQLPATKYFIAAKQFEMAREHLLIYKQLSTQAHFLAGLTNSFKYAYKIDSSQKRYFSALDNYQHYTFLRDSVYNIKKSKQIEELKIRYETEKKEKDNISLKKEGLLQADRVKQADHTRDLTLIATVCLLIIVIVLYRGYWIKQRNSKVISGKNDSLNQLVTEKEWLLKEIHHRVKNNLQIVTGLLQRQSAYIDNDEAMAAIQNSENRMHSIALIHQKLYQSNSLDMISMPDYIAEMIGYLEDSFGLDNRIVFEKHLEEIRLDVAQAVPVGLILNEAVTNAIKYAYPGEETGIIYITLTGSNDGCNQLTIADNGPGFPEDFNIERVNSLGVNLMRGLSKQLGGILEISNDQGCTVAILFKTEIFSKS
ncbi:MAG: tetratricopeptide repeat protein [Bacteroidota bacterium]|nr:tetratricopeptide repeat protein [Bacteroidota bacterium]